MKNLYFILAMCMATNAFAQNSFPTSNAIWDYTVSAEAWLSGLKGEKTIYYTICGDTTINDNVYYKLYTTLDTIICGDNLEEFKGYFRQDEQKVYFTPYYKEYYAPYPIGHVAAHFGPEFLSYDFGLSIGDTIELDYGFYYRFWKYVNYTTYYHNHEFEFDVQHRTLIVTDIGHVNGRKIINLEAIDLPYGQREDTWVEGMGSTHGLFFKGRPMLDGYSFDFTLNCFKHNDTAKYVRNLDCNKCFCMNYINIKEHINCFDNIKVYPNPTTGELQVTSYELQITSAEIFDVYGRKLSSHPHIPSSSNQKIDISHLNSGIYFVNITTDAGTIIKKAIKQ